jgi:hypothetical protein
MLLSWASLRLPGKTAWQDGVETMPKRKDMLPI